MSHKHQIQFRLEGDTMASINERMAEICNHYFGVGEWDYSLETFTPAVIIAGEPLPHRPRFASTVTAWATE